MVQGGAGSTGATSTGNNEKFASERFATAIVNLAKKNQGEDLDRIVSNLLLQNPDLQKLISQNQTAEKVKFPKKQIIKLLKQNPEFLQAIEEHLQANPNEQKQLIEELSKDPTAIQKVNSLGKTLAIAAGIGVGIIGSGILGGVIGANLAAVGAGLAVAAPFIGIGAGVLLTIALIGLAIYKKEAISKGIGNATKYAGEKVTHLLKNLIDKLPFRSSNAVNHLAKLEHDYVQAGYNKTTDNLLPNDAVFIKKYFLDEDRFQALKSLIAADKDGKIPVKDRENENVELTLEDLKILEKKGNSTFKGDSDEFKEKLDKFKLIMSETNKGVREQIETKIKVRAEVKQDKIHRKDKLQTPLPSSALCRNSIANTEFRKVVDENINGLLEKVAELKDTGKNQGFRQDFHKFAQDSYGLDTSILEKRGGLTETESKNLAEQFKNLNPQQIKELSAKVVELKKDQDRGPKTQKDQVPTPQKYTPIEEPGLEV